LKTIRVIVALTVVIIGIICVDRVSAKDRWYAGAVREVLSNGITAIISTPQNPLEIYTYGESNWVTAYYIDGNGRDWLQTGWIYLKTDSIPKQYVEWCLDYGSPTQTCGRAPDFATQGWGNSIAYWVFKQNNARWCAYPAGIETLCVDNLSSNSLGTQVASEIHKDPRNALDTTFDQVRYKDPSDNLWKPYDDPILWVEEFAYRVERSSNSHFRTYRLTTKEIFLPLIFQ